MNNAATYNYVLCPNGIQRYLVNPFVILVMEGAPSVARPHNLAGFSTNFFTTLITCSDISSHVVKEEGLVKSKYSSTTSKPTVTAVMIITDWTVSHISVLSFKARQNAAHDFYLYFKISLLLIERSFLRRETVMRERLACSTKCFFFGHAYSVNNVKQFLMNSPSPKDFPFSVIDLHNFKLSLVTTFETFL